MRAYLARRRWWPLLAAGTGLVGIISAANTSFQFTRTWWSSVAYLVLCYLAGRGAGQIALWLEARTAR